MSEWGVCVGCPWHDTPVREGVITSEAINKNDRGAIFISQYIAQR